ncbi:hypothetical protein [Aquiflexum sp.]|uniref:hypothetical protein n=1 Tax=Aquiflexum sp. TaxID=1872584 RepID=UPI0035943E44
MAKFIFRETQRFNQTWIWAILVLVTGITFYGIFTQPVEGWDIIIPIIILGLVFMLFVSLQLKTRIDENGLSFSYFPLISQRKYSTDQIKKLELIEYNSLTKFGGWGIRFNFAMWGYNVGGKHGLIVTLKDKKFLIGTQKPEEMQKAIKQFEELKSA